MLILPLVTQAGKAGSYQFCMEGVTGQVVTEQKTEKSRKTSYSGQVLVYFKFRLRMFTAFSTGGWRIHSHIQHTIAAVHEG